MASLADWTSDRPAGLLSRMFGFGQTHSLTCQQVTMDDLLRKERIPEPDFIKCDVEGAELMVFQGARDTLDRIDAPIILFEVGAEAARGFGLKATEAADFLSTLDKPGYRFLELLDGEEVRNVMPEHFKSHNQNIVAVPKSKHFLCPELAGAAVRTDT